MNDRELDPSQQAAVGIAPGERQVVIAGPGSGKTEVVARLVERLVEDQDVDRSAGILVVAFSNAAVFAAGGRLTINGSGPAAVQTLDSLASEIIRDLSADDPAGLGFDDRIFEATRLLTEGDWTRLDGLEHLVVDEVQDIVGVRADLLLRLLGRLPAGAGFSLLGDPAQGIYDWQLRVGRTPSTTTSAELIATVSAADRVVVRHLTGQYRALSRDAQKVLALRGSVVRPEALSPLDDVYAGLLSVASITEVIRQAENWIGTTAFLTASNGQALLAADVIAATGATVEVRRSARQRVLARWIAEAVAGHPTPGMRRDELEARITSLAPQLDPAAAWASLRSVTVGRGRELDLVALANGLRRPTPVSPDLLEPAGARFVVSTIHRAKGLEFDHVVTVDSPDSSRSRQDESPVERAEATRTLFVALSRARELLLRAKGPDDRWLRSLPVVADRPRRWYVGGWDAWRTTGFELGVDDLDRSAPPGEDSVETQEYIAASVRPGDPLRLTLDRGRSTVLLPVWTLRHGDHVVGRTSPQFGEDIVRRIGTLEKKRRTWPTLRGARVESLATVSGDPQARGAGRFGLWSSPVCASMLQIDWNGDSDD